MSRINTPEFRVAFPHVFKPKKNNLSGDDEFCLVALFPKGANLNGLKKAAMDAVIETWGPDKNKWPKGLKTPFKDQGEREKTNDDGSTSLPDGYEKGCVYLNLKSTQRPSVVDQAVQEILNPTEFYGGCWAIASVNAYTYDHTVNKGVTFGLGNVQKSKEDDAFGNRSTPQDDFTPVVGAETEQSATDIFN